MDRLQSCEWTMGMAQKMTTFVLLVFSDIFARGLVIFGRVRKNSKKKKILKVLSFISARLSVRSHRTTQLPQDGF